MEYVAKPEARNFLLGGAILLVLGLFLPVVELRVGGVEGGEYTVFDLMSDGGLFRIIGSDISEGSGLGEYSAPRNILLLAIVLVAVGIYLINSQNKLENILYGHIVGIVGGFTGIVTFYELYNVVTTFDRLASTITNLPSDSYRLTLGAYVILGGGIVSLIGGGLGIVHITEIYIKQKKESGSSTFPQNYPPQQYSPQMSYDPQTGQPIQQPFQTFANEQMVEQNPISQTSLEPDPPEQTSEDVPQSSVIPEKLSPNSGSPPPSSDGKEPSNDEQEETADNLPEK